MMVDSELETLGTRECLDLVATQQVGRLVFNEDSVPAVRLVNYSFHGNKIVLRLGRSHLADRLNHNVVAFEVDDLRGHLDRAAGRRVARAGARRRERAG